MYSDVGRRHYVQRPKPECIVISQSATLCTDASKLECIVMSRSVTGVSQPECIVISWSATLCTEASKPECIKR